MQEPANPSMLAGKGTRERIRKGKGRSELIQSTSVDSVFSRTAFPSVEGGVSRARKEPLHGTPGPLGSG